MDLNLATVSQFTPREKLLYDKIRKESALCKLGRKCRKNLKFVSDEVNTLTEDILTSLNAEGMVIEGYF
jgi:hypothetical protein